MTDILLRMFCAAVVIPGAVLCCLPASDHLRIPPGKLALWGVPTALLWAFLAAFVCWGFKLDMNLLLLPSLAVFALMYVRAVDLPAWKSVSVFLAVCALFSILDNIALEILQLIVPGAAEEVSVWQGPVIYNLLCWVTVGLLWYPASRPSRWLLGELEMPNTWYVFWILPLAFMVLNICLPAGELSAVRMGGSVPAFLALLVFLLALLLLCYAMFYIMARSLGENMRLQSENNLLQLEASQYESLKNSIEETRRIRHDLRQHMAAIQGCADRGDMAGLLDYIAKFRESSPGYLDESLSFCDNCAVNSVLRFYAEKARNAGVEFNASVQMSEHIPVPEPELCVLLGNLLENALNACAGQKGKPFIRVNILQNGASMLTVTVDNPCPLPPAWEGQRLISRRRDAPGIGTESVKAIARRCHGDARFQWEDGMFYASVMLNP